MYAQGYTPTVVHASPYGAPVYGPTYAQPCVQQPGPVIVQGGGGGHRADDCCAGACCMAIFCCCCL